MRIGIDISQLAYPGSGVFRYTKSLVESLLSLQSDSSFVLFYSSLRKPLQFSFDAKVLEFKFPPTLLDLVWNKLHLLPIDLLIGKVDVFHTSDWVEPPSFAPKVTTIHDLVVFKYPESLPQKILDIHQRKLKWVAKESKFIIAVSNSTKRDIMEIFNIPSEEIRVIYSGVESRFVPSEDRHYEPYFLCVGTIEPRKNLSVLFEAFAKIADEIPQHKLIVVGKGGWKQGPIFETVRRLGIEEKVEFAGYVTDERLIGLYQKATAFVYPSLYEGFGLPILEAMGCGVPVVASNSSSLPELGGNVAFYANSNDIDDFSRQLLKCAYLTTAERENLRNQGVLRAKRFSWERTAKETLEVYKNACRN